MPATRAQDDSAIPRCIKIFDEFLFSLLQNLFFNFLAFPVLSVQFTREFPGFDRAVPLSTNAALSPPWPGDQPHSNADPAGSRCRPA